MSPVRSPLQPNISKNNEVYSISSASKVKDEVCNQRRSSNKKVQAQKSLKVDLRRQLQLDQASHLFRNGFQLLICNRNFSSYRFTIRNILGKKEVKFTVYVPNDYPGASLRLSEYPEVEEREYSVQLRTLIFNFNWKCKQWNKEEIPIASQLNYLVSEWKRLLFTDFLKTEVLRQNFYNSITK
ncbi:Smu2p Ecym_5677 [Eremothecium cymbalariae DBVPG|uniref:Uncharacterized protein n=1 Tax=Eremothecium cymbalariae (strain CBS 270.75 / DBVPG 7215 / KCTC 17166 / NRRL Y-17582) TaxID=931890 RepID=I6NEB5_ERECY|nr:hypothetical protein Ecym_5677 [Eremothecium cymbalariae DBVPG\